MEIEKLQSILEVISAIATIIGIPVAIFLYIDGKRKERIERASAVYDSLDQWYADFLRLSFENTELAAIYYAPLLGRKEPLPILDRRSANAANPLFRDADFHFGACIPDLPQSAQVLTQQTVERLE